MRAAMLALVLAGLAASSAQAAPAPTGVDGARLSEMTRILASDMFEGRGPGSAGEKRTIEWLIAQFSALGLQPGGEDGGWIQAVPLLHTQVDTRAPLTVSDAGNVSVQALKQGQDVYVTTLRDVDRARIASAPLVYVGYGVSAPERGWDDFKGVDLTGKVAVMLINDPDFDALPAEPVAGRFGGPAMTYYGRWTYKYEEAARRGAIGALIVHDTPGAAYGWNTVIAGGGENFTLAKTNGAEAPPLMLQGWLSGEAAASLFTRAGLDLPALRVASRRSDFRPVPLGALNLSADVPVTREVVASANVIAKLPGTTRREETIAIGAHWDAYGIDPKSPPGAPVIRPGALDDAIGIAGMMEIARLFKAGPPPARTLVFAAWTAEERGLLGSEAFARSGLYPLDRMVANLTLDVLQTAGRSRDVVLIGAGQNSLEDDLVVAARTQGRTVTPDGKPERGLFYRADHFPFARRGVPTLLMMAIGGGPDLVRGGRAAGDKWVSDYTAHCYHQACDTWRADWDMAGAVDDVELVRQIVARYAFGDAWPSWRPQSEFAPLRPAR